MRVRALIASFNPTYYDPKEIAAMDYDKAKYYFQHDNIKAAYYKEHTLDLRTPNELQLMQDGLTGGDTTDAMIVWIKID